VTTPRWIHQTDLFRPHIDPDDHWDLACVMALAGSGRVKLEGVVIDSPPAATPPLNPDAVAVAQMNYLRGLSAPFVTGSSAPFASGVSRTLEVRDRAAMRFILDTLQSSSDPVTIHIVGSCRDVALALDAAPELFRANCAGIYLNAGQGAPDPETWVGLEYNVAVNAAAYQSLFSAPCPLYWVPCYYAIYEDRTVREYASWWDFEQGEVLRDLPGGFQNYFLSVLGQRPTADWLSDLLGPVDAAALETFSRKRRNMWSTAGFLHASGRAVRTSGEIVALEDAGSDALFGFLPVTVQCDDAGRTRWQHADEGTERFIFRVNNIEHYASAMTRAVKTLLLEGLG
jgi:hypothetical protein